MTSSIILKKSSIAERVPVTGDLAYGELALNYADGALYYKRSDNTIQNLLANSSPLTLTRYMEIIAVSKSTVLVNGTDIIGAIEIPVTGTITNIRAKTASGTATITFNKNASSIGSVNATTSGVSSSVSSSVTANDLLTLDVSSASGSGLVVIITIIGN